MASNPKFWCFVFYLHEQHVEQNVLALVVYDQMLTYWGRVTHICVDKLAINKIQWFFIAVQTFSLTKIRLKMSSVKCCSFPLGLNMLIKHLLLYQQELISNDKVLMTIWKRPTWLIVLYEYLSPMVYEHIHGIPYNLIERWKFRC